MNRVLWFIALSLIIHLAGWWVVPPYTPPSPTPNAIEVSLPDTPMPQDKHAKQFVHQNLPKLNDLKPKTPKYLGEHDQTVEKEMKATRSGLTSNTATLKKGGQSGNDKQDEQKSEDGESFSVQQKKKGSSGKDLYTMNATNDNYLPDVANGPITLLSTERFVYYSFFARIQEAVYPRWQRYVNEAVLRMTDAETKQAEDKGTYTTVLDVIVNINGMVEQVVIKKSCGNERLDRAAQQAFLAARQFPNPPKGLVKEDGKLHLPYGTHVEMSTVGAFAFRNSRRL